MSIAQFARLCRSTRFRPCNNPKKGSPSSSSCKKSFITLSTSHRQSLATRAHRIFKSYKLSPSETVHISRNHSQLLLYAISSGIIITLIFNDAIPLSALASTNRLDKIAAQVVPIREEPLLRTMPAGTAPGRPDNLTEDQEQNLRELWKALLKLFGEWDGDGGSTIRENGIASTPGSDNQSSAISQDSPALSNVATDSKKHRSRLNPFSKKHKGENEGSVSSGKSQGAHNSPIDGESDSGVDKHGLKQSFREALAQQSPTELRDIFWSMIKHDNPDAILLRFLRARKWDVQAALVMLVSALHWRSAEMHVDDDILKHGEAGALSSSLSSDSKIKKEGEDFLQQLRLGKSFLHGYDREGRPMCIVRVKLHRQGEQSEASLERFTVFTLETARLLLRSPVDTATLLFDMTGFSMANMDYAPVKFIIKCFEANYPESLGAVIVYRAPWIFQSIWAIIRGWLDPVVAGKVQFTKTVDDLTAFIPRERIPRELDGDEDFTYSYVEPKQNENAPMNDIATRDQLVLERNSLITQYVSATKFWIDGDSSSIIKDPVQLQSIQGKRHELVMQLKANYWRLDPYVRARCLYDRLGTIKPDGNLQFYPSG